MRCIQGLYTSEVTGTANSPLPFPLPGSQNEIPYYMVADKAFPLNHRQLSQMLGAIC